MVNVANGHKLTATGKRAFASLFDTCCPMLMPDNFQTGNYRALSIGQRVSKRA